MSDLDRRIAANYARDFGPEIQLGCRVESRLSGERGWALRFRDFTDSVYYRQAEPGWRPRDLVVLPDAFAGLPDDHAHGLDYFKPDETVRIPEWWPTRGIGEGPRQRSHGFMDTIVRVDPPAKGLWLMNRKDRGWAEKSYHYQNWGELLRHWSFRIGETGRDAAGRFVHVHRVWL